MNKKSSSTKRVMSDKERLKRENEISRLIKKVRASFKRAKIDAKSVIEESRAQLRKRP
jgi:hypothetical protein